MSAASSAPTPNASIWPVQLRDGHPRSPPATKHLAPVQLDRLDFEDVSYFFHFHRIAKLARGLALDDGSDGDSDRSVEEVGRSIVKSGRPSQANGSGGRGTPNGKAKASRKRPADRAPSSGTSSRPAKAVKLSNGTSSRSPLSPLLSDPTTVLVDTACIFRVKARSASDRGHVSDLVQALQAEGETFQPEMRPDQFSNGSWIPAARTLCSAGELDLSASLRIFEPPPQKHRTERAEAASLHVELRIKIAVPLSAGSGAGALRPAVIEDMAELVRFADALGSERDEVDRRKKVNARLVMDHLHPAELAVSDHIQPPDLNPTLMPFQRRSTAFILGREGKAIGQDGAVEDTVDVISRTGSREVGLWWKKIDDGLFYHFLEGRFVANADLTRYSNLRGAMLAEEMGLGKTVEVIALILLNPRHGVSSERSWFDADNSIEVHPTKTTLIVAPETLRQQWVDELARHAPELCVYSYTSRQDAENDTPPGQTWVQWASSLDVIVTSFHVLGLELTTAKPEPERSRRHPRKYERPRSPLIRLHFHRVVMDEVQMVGSQTSAAETAAMLHRGSSLAVSGTPVKKIDDIKSCFRFLRMPCCSGTLTARSWDKILSPKLAPALVAVMETIATRHTKAGVAHEMTLPTQTRSVVPVDFTAIEAAFYADVWKDALSAVGIDSDGKPLLPNWQLDINVLGRHLLLLRQACTHPQVAVHGRGGGVAGSQNLRSIDEVLELMVDSTKAELQSMRGQYFDRRITKVILSLYYRDERKHAVAEAQMLDLAKELRSEAGRLEDDLKATDVQGPLYNFSDRELELEAKEASRQAALGPSHRDEDDDRLSGAHGAVSAGQGSSPEWQSLCADPAYQEKRRQRSANHARISHVLRLVYLRLHRVLQFTGNLYFQMGEFVEDRESKETANAAKVKDVDAEPQAEITIIKGEDGTTLAAKPGTTRADDEDAPEVGKAGEVDEKAQPAPTEAEAKRAELKAKEDAAYEAAERMRQKILSEQRLRVEHAVERLGRSKVDFGLAQIKCRADPVLEDGGGITTGDLIDALIETMDLLDRQARVIFEWRKDILDRLRRAVNRDVNLERDDDDQYQENLDTQAEAEVLLEMYRPLLAERELIISGTVAVGATAKPQLYVELETAVRNARRQQLLSGIGNGGGDDDDEDGPDDDVLRVHKQQLAHFKKLDAQKKDVSLPDLSRCLGSLRARLKEASEGDIPEAERKLAETASSEARRIGLEQTRLLVKLKTEAQTMLGPLFNARTNFFRELQMLSDSVGDPSFTDLDRSIRTAGKEEASLRAKSDALEGRLRYLTHLGSVQSIEASASDGDDARRCYICTEMISTGVLPNACGHVCCERCFKEWQGQGHRSCPMCKTRVLPNEVHRIVYHKTNTTSAASTSAEGRDGRPSDIVGGAEYRLISAAHRDQIDRGSVNGRYGSKIDLVAKHIQHLFTTRGEKSIVFSSFTRGLDVIAQSLTANGLRFIRMTGAGKVASKAAAKFHEPQVAAMLLHSEAQSSGLNLTVASHIHILEPFLDRSVEAQALGRIHRIGQTKETNVWVYKVNDTVEGRILDAAARRGESFYLVSQPSSAATSSTGPAKSLETEEGAVAKFRPAATRGKNKEQGLRGDTAKSREELVEVFSDKLAARLGGEGQADGATGENGGEGSVGWRERLIEATSSSSSCGGSSSVGVGGSGSSSFLTTPATTSGVASRQSGDSSTTSGDEQAERQRALRLAAIERRLGGIGSGGGGGGGGGAGAVEP
ncbi:related to IRC20 - putative helicase [Pseudozyma flocculosa]|uniref:Related to IRC20 - putative helicase n=1 Tax=Pseudozyma flocculosa TaxID=84751 RepID=A0A5C3F016_9BASI|nr:related to IRC20 - putative helicase [Pseudozyma flocculosa]